MEWLKDIKLLVFDLDGTLYQDEKFVRSYLTYLFKSESFLEHWYLEAEQILNGQHALKMGHFYNKSLKSGVRHQSGEIIDLYDWSGNNKEYSKGTLLYSKDDFQYIGDAWGIIGVIADYADIPVSNRTEAFMNVRRDMISELDSVKPHKGIITAIRALKSTHHKLLMTNSPEEAAVDFVAKLNLENDFDAIIYGGDKPEGLSNYLQQYISNHGILPEQILSIGDNAWNDLYPVRKMGGRTVWISPYETHDEELWDLRLRTMDELEAFLLKFELISSFSDY